MPSVTTDSESSYENSLAPSDAKSLTADSRYSSVVPSWPSNSRINSSKAARGKDVRRSTCVFDSASMVKVTVLEVHSGAAFATSTAVHVDGKLNSELQAAGAVAPATARLANAATNQRVSGRF